MSKASDGAATVKDPVCGMTVKIATAKHTTEHDGTTYYFCSPKCLRKFTEEPRRYLKPAEAPQPPLPKGRLLRLAPIEVLADAPWRAPLGLPATTADAGVAP